MDRPTRAASAPLRDDPVRDRLSVLLADSGLSLSRFARAIGVDRGTVSDWLSGGKAIPESRRAWIAALVRIETTSERVTVVVGA